MTMDSEVLENKTPDIEEDKALLNAYKVRTDVYEGPFDLMLAMIDKGELDLNKLSLSAVTAGFLDYIKSMEQLNIVVGGEFLLMAAYLLEMKSKMLLPQQPLVQEDENLLDVEQDLLQRLAEYKIYKRLAEELRARKDVFQRVYTRYSPEEAAKDQEIFLVDVSLKDLVYAFKRVWEEAESRGKTEEIMGESISVDERITEISILVKGSPSGLKFRDLFRQFIKIEIIVTFLAILELIKRKAIRIMQGESFGDIFIFSSEAKI